MEAMNFKKPEDDRDQPGMNRIENGHAATKYQIVMLQFCTTAALLCITWEILPLFKKIYSRFKSVRYILSNNQ